MKSVYGIEDGHKPIPETVLLKTGGRWKFRHATERACMAGKMMEITQETR